MEHVVQVGADARLIITRDASGRWNLSYRAPGRDDIEIQLEDDARARHEITRLLAGSMRPEIDLGS